MSQEAIVGDTPVRTITPVLTFVLAFACGLIVANHYYAQPLAGLIGAFFDIPPAETGLIVTLTYVGYGLGLLFFVPLGDLVENRKLVIMSLCVAAAALIAMAAAQIALSLLVAAFVLGIATTALQLLLPYAAHFTTEADRGRVIGSLTSGLMLGIMLARPAASFIAYYLDWRAVFEMSAALMVLVTIILAVRMPAYKPRSALSYAGILRSLPMLMRDIPVFRRRVAYHTALFAAFSMFWTAVPLLLADMEFGFTQQGIGLFAFAGAGGVVIAPIAGWIADRGLTRPATGLAILAVLCAFVVALAGSAQHSIALLVLAAIVIDAGLVTNFVLSQRAIYGPKPESRSRIGGLFTAIFFLGGAIGSAVATASFAHGGWPFTTFVGITCAVFALVIYAGEFLGPANKAGVLRASLTPFLSCVVRSRSIERSPVSSPGRVDASPMISSAR